MTRFIGWTQNGLAGFVVWVVTAMLLGSSGMARPQQAGNAPPMRSTASGDLRFHTFRSQVFGNRRQLRVLVPAGYDDPANHTKRYPVLYLNDGQELFDTATAVFNPMEWQVDETVQKLVGAGELPPLIVVGIDNAGRQNRPREYLPYVDTFLRPPEPNPQGKRFPEFLVDEVMPFINAHYRTLRDAASTGLGGSSYGGLLTVYLAVARPGVFGRLLVESPSLYVAEGQIFRDVEHVTKWPERIYLGVGTNEGGRPACNAGDPPSEPEAISDVLKLQRFLRRAGVEAKHIKVVVEPCAVHNEAAWAARLPDALRFLFGR